MDGFKVLELLSWASERKLKTKIYNHTRFYSRIYCWKSVRIRSFLCSVFLQIWTEYGHLQNKCSYSVQIRENTDQEKLSILAFLRMIIVLILVRTLKERKSEVHRECYLKKGVYSQINSFMTEVSIMIATSVIKESNQHIIVTTK